MTFTVLQLHTFLNVFTGSALSYGQYKDDEPGPLDLQRERSVLTYERPHHWIIHLPHGLQRHPAVHVNGSCQRLKDVSHGLWYLDVLLLLLVFFRPPQLTTQTHGNISEPGIHQLKVIKLGCYWIIMTLIYLTVISPLLFTTISPCVINCNWSNFYL